MIRCFASVVCLVAALGAVAGCDRESGPARDPIATETETENDPAAEAVAVTDKPLFIAGEVPVAPFVAEQMAMAKESTTFVYVGAQWCEPCRHFKSAVKEGGLDEELRAVRFVEYDVDKQGTELTAAGYTPPMLPYFAQSRSDGRATGYTVAGSVKGPDAVGHILPRLKKMIEATP